MKKSIFFMLLTALIYSFAASVYADDVNIAEGAKTEVEFFDKNNKGLVADISNIDALTDGNSYSLYKTPVGTETASITVDLYYQSNFNRVYMREINSTITGFEIYTSDNKRNWTMQYTGSGVGTYGKNACFDMARARYIKIKITKTANQYNDASISFSDIMVYNSDTIIKEDLENIIYLAKIKEKYIGNDTLKDHFEENDYNVLMNEIENAEEVLNSQNPSQAMIDNAYKKLDKEVNKLSIDEISNSDFDIIEEKYEEYFVKNNSEKTESRLKTIDNLGNEAAEIQSKILRSPKAAELWAEYTAPMANSAQEPSKISNSLAKIKKMAIVYKQEGNRFYKDKGMYDDILYTLNFILDKKYSPSVVMYGNWYYWQVSAPATMTDIMVILKDDLSQEMLDKMENAVIYRIGNDFHYTWYGANRMYLAAISLKLGVATNNNEYIHRAVYALAEENASKDKQSENSSGDDDGYFWDGSYMFHSGIMYNATYGRDQLGNTLSIIDYLYETPWQIEQGMLDDMAKRIHDVYEYIIYNGYSVDAAAGRGLGAGKSYGLNIANSIQQLAGYLSNPTKTELLSIAKQIKQEQNIDDDLTRDESIPARGRITKLKCYPIGDRLILHTPDFGFTLSMFSDRTKTFEAPNGDAMQAWYVSSGMTQLLSDDRTQYDRDYWISSDRYRLPGTTVDRITRSLTRYEGEIYNANDWCGMVDYEGLYGVAGMMGHNWNSSMTAKKSYFIFDNEIVCLGTDISKGTNDIETTVENRKLKDDMSNTILVNGENFSNNKDTLMNDVKTVWLEGNNDKNNIGYYFFNKDSLHMLKETRTGAERDMWLSDTENTVTNSYFTMWYNHGKRPENSSYAYALLPNFTEEETEQYSNAPDTEILDKTSDVHSVRENNTGITGYNFWSKTGGKGTGVSTDGVLTLITKNSDSEFEASMTDPTFKLQRAVTVNFDINVNSIIESDSRIEVLSTSPLKIRVDLKEINGHKVTIKCTK